MLLAVLLLATATASVEYYRQVRKAQKEYQKAKGIVEDIVLSFNRELKRDADKLDVIAFKIEGNLAKAESSLKKVDMLEKRIAPLENQISSVSQADSQNSTNFLIRISWFRIEN